MQRKTDRNWVGTDELTYLSQDRPWRTVQLENEESQVDPTGGHRWDGRCPRSAYYAHWTELYSNALSYRA